MLDSDVFPQEAALQCWTHDVNNTVEQPITQLVCYSDTSRGPEDACKFIHSFINAVNVLK